MKTLSVPQKPFPWKKMGQLYEPQNDGFTHGSHPCLLEVEPGQFVIAFTRRDSQQRSHIFLVHAKFVDGRLKLVGTPKLALVPGAPGTFDCDGVISVCFVPHKGKHYLYYVGWQNLPEGLWICDTGRSILNVKSLTLEKEFSGPVFGRDKSNPLFAAATAFHVSGDNWRTWYNSGIKWEKTEKGWHHHYGIHHAHSKDGINWVSDPGMCLPFADKYEYAFGRPSVYSNNGTFFMWFAHRATEKISAYRMGFAHSKDGIRWQRKDSFSGIDVSSDGWDSEMICYPYIFEYQEKLYMLYNGNNYGKTGFGLAEMEIQ